MGAGKARDVSSAGDHRFADSADFYRSIGAVPRVRRVALPEGLGDWSTGWSCCGGR